MGNRAVITTKAHEIGVYVHWNGGRDSINGFLAYCRMMDFREPEKDSYGWARLVQVIANFFGGDGLGVGIDRYSELDADNGDNGVYVIEGWNIVAREYFEAGCEQTSYELGEFLRALNERQPGFMQATQEEIDRFLQEHGHEYIR